MRQNVHTAVKKVIAFVISTGTQLTCFGVLNNLSLLLFYCVELYLLNNNN